MSNKMAHYTVKPAAGLENVILTSGQASYLEAYKIAQESANQHGGDVYLTWSPMGPVLIRFRHNPVAASPLAGVTELRKAVSWANAMPEYYHDNKSAEEVLAAYRKFRDEE